MGTLMWCVMMLAQWRGQQTRILQITTSKPSEPALLQLEYRQNPPVSAWENDALTWKDATGTGALTCKPGATGTDLICKAVKPEPVDVPAIQETRRMKIGEISVCRKDFCRKKESSVEPVYGNETVWTCADKSNVLWTAEDGKHWCHRVQP